jgi:uncharacterized protein (DUF885 family)
MMRVLAGAALALLMTMSSVATAQDAASAFASVVRDFELYERANDPISAGFEGDRAALARLPDPSPAADARRKAALEGFRARLAAIDARALSAETALDREFLSRIVASRLESLRYDEARIPFRNDSGFWSLGDYLASSTRIRNAADAEAWLARLDAMPAYWDAHVANMRRGMATRMMQPRVVVDAALTSVRAIPADADASPLMAPLKTLPGTIPAADADALRARGRATIASKVLPAQRALLAFMENEYRPRAPTRLAARDLPNGPAYYAWLIREHTTTNMTPDEVHALGLAEVTRIRGRMDEVIREVGYQGSFADFQRMLRTEPRFYAQTPEELLMRASEIAKRADDKLPSLFRTLPRLSYGVRPVPMAIAPAYTTGRYFSGSPEQGVAGGLMINTTKLDQRGLYELPALALHEGAPGHHIQIALAQERTDLPWFRRNAEVTAFTEGWGLYAEYLGEEMGIYRDPYERFGRLSYEMWRACRLVADTGIHWKRWTMAQARRCFDENSALSPHNITTELERYVSWPGQADAYKIGEIELRRLRAKAEAALGPRFDVRDFHDAILRDGPLPLDLLGRRIDAWIASRP